jgi:hypothetical protein
MSSLVSVVGSNFMGDWKSQITPPHNPLVQFHTKFWGVRVADLGGEQKDDMEINNSIAESGDINPCCYILDIDI